MSTKLLTAPRFVLPGSLGHHRDTHMRAASIKLVQAGQAFVCFTSCAPSNGSSGRTHISTGRRLPPAALWWYKQREGHTGMPDGDMGQWRWQVPEIVITKADNVSVLPLCETWMCFRGIVWRKRLNNSYDCMSRASPGSLLAMDNIVSTGAFMCSASELC